MKTCSFDCAHFSSHLSDSDIQKGLLDVKIGELNLLGHMNVLLYNINSLIFEILPFVQLILLYQVVGVELSLDLFPDFY